MRAVTNYERGDCVLLVTSFDHHTFDLHRSYTRCQDIRQSSFINRASRDRWTDKSKKHVLENSLVDRLFDPLSNASVDDTTKDTCKICNRFCTKQDDFFKYALYAEIHFDYLMLSPISVILSQFLLFLKVFN